MKINYERFKKSFSQKVVFHEGKYQVKKVTKISGYDFLLRRWNKVEEIVEFLPLSALMNPPKKVVETDIIILRSATDYKTLRNIEAFFKKSMRVSVRDLENNIYLVFVHGKVFLTDLTTTCPLQLTRVEKNKQIKVEFIGIEEKLTEEEKDALVKKGVPVFEERAMPNNQTEYVLLV